jgi:tetratricopeptide (TPR) repeat protein
MLRSTLAEREGTNVIKLRRLEVALLLAGVVFGCNKLRGRASDKAASTQAVMPGLPGPAGVPGRLSVGSAAFHLERGSLYERYNDPKTAAEDFAKAAELTDKPNEAVMAFIGLGRARQAQGDVDGAVAALEHGQAALEKVKTTPASPGAPPVDAFRQVELASLLARLYEQKGDSERAGRLAEQALRGAPAGFQRDELIRIQVTVATKAGRLDKEIAAREAQLSAKDPPEEALRFLALAYQPRPTAGAPTGAAAPTEKLIAVYERLSAKHPEERGMLASFYERAGRVEDAARILRGLPRPQPVRPSAGSPGAEACPPGGMRVQAPAIAATMDVARLYARTQHKAEAERETASLERGADAASLVTAARLRLESSDPAGMAAATRDLAAASKVAVSREDEDDVSFARADLLTRSGKREELAALYQSWKDSNDACLRAEAARREAMQSRMAAIAGGGPTGATKPASAAASGIAAPSGAPPPASAAPSMGVPPTEPAPPPPGHPARRRRHTR